MKNLIIGFLLAFIIALCFTPAFGVHSKKEARRQAAQLREYEQLSEKQFKAKELQILESIDLSLKRIASGISVTTYSPTRTMD